MNTARGQYCLELAWLLTSGLPPRAAYGILTEDAPTEALRSASLKAAQLTREGLEAGEALAQTRALPRALGPVLRAAERAGHLPNALEGLGLLLEQREEHFRRLRRALAKPLPATLITLGVSGLVLGRLGPDIQQAFQAAGLPAARSPLAGLTLSADWLLQVIALGLASAGAILFLSDLPTTRRPLARLLLDLPGLGQLLWLADTARYCLILGLLLDSGVTLIRALRTAAHTMGNAELRARLDETPSTVRRGGSLTLALAHTRALPPFTLSLVRRGERTGQLPRALEHAAEHADRRLESRLHRFTTALEPVIWTLLGALLVGLGLTVWGPLLALVRWSP